MNIKGVGKELFLSALVYFPAGAVIVRQWDSITADRKFKSIEANIERLFKLIEDNPRCPLQDAILEAVELVDRNGLIEEKTFVKFKECMAIMQKLNFESKQGYANDPLLDIYQCSDVLRKVSDSTDLMEELRLVTYELEKEELIYRHVSANSPIGFHQISPRDYFFCKTDKLFQAWNPMQDADDIIQHIVSKKEDAVGLQELDQIFKWGPRRINPAVAYLYLTDMIDDSHELGGAIVTGYVLSWIRLTEEAYLRKST